jgi:hypothetical protein
VRSWIRERTDDFELLDDRSRPTVRDDYGKCISVTGPNVNEMNVDPVDVRRELWECIELRFRLSPVVAVAPVPDELLQPVQRHALRVIGFLVGPPRALNPAAKVLERRLRHLSLEGPDRAIFGRFGVAQGRKDAKPDSQRSRFVKLHGRTSLPGALNVTVCPMKTLRSASTTSISVRRAIRRRP